MPLSSNNLSRPVTPLPSQALRDCRSLLTSLLADLHPVSAYLRFKSQRLEFRLLWLLIRYSDCSPTRQELDRYQALVGLLQASADQQDKQLLELSHHP